MFTPRTLAESTVPMGRGPLARAVGVTGVLAAVLTAILTLSISPGAVNLDVGQVAPQEIRAPRAITFDSPSETEARRQEAASKVVSQYEQIAPPMDIANAPLRSFDELVKGVSQTLQDRDDGTITAAQVPSRLAQIASPKLSDAQIALVAAMSRTRWVQLAAAARTVLASIQAGAVREDDLDTVRDQARGAITEELPTADRDLAGNLAANLIAPNQRVNASLTETARQAARDAVTPVEVQVAANEVIVHAGDKITALAHEELDRLGLTSPRLKVSTVAGEALLGAVLAILLVGFLWRFQPQIWYRNQSLLLFMLTLVASAVVIRLAGERSLWTFVVPTSAAVLLIGILLDGYAGAAMAAALAMLAGLVNPNGLETATYVLAGGAAALMAVARAERLNAFLRAGVVIGLTNVAVVVAFGLLDGTDLTGMLQLSAAGLVNAALSVVLAVGSFAMLGNLFGIMTIFQLLELANPSSRLLRRLLLETPGTYHHSVMVGNLAERAAETIGADPLLARVAAYYHDIGKMKNPLAFIENQAGARNIHDDLDPETSARIIAGHIRDGIDLGYEYGLPVQIIGFIPQHHGTSVMSYFYGKAVQEAGGDPSRANKDTFRYPGPKPQSREAAILMLSDGVEASVRSLDSKDEASIRAMVASIVDARLEDGQLDEADLTLRNLSQIKDAFVQQLLGMYHSRINYPDNVLDLDERRQA
jgi:putative nucleotidyltransferase with HDIG domain